MKVYISVFGAVLSCHKLKYNHNVSKKLMQIFSWWIKRLKVPI